jgi:glycosyltransferase involved in cell wall biosynthesis
MAICHNQGQMIKVKNNELCTNDSLSQCVDCFPEESEAKFWIRKNYIQNEFELVDYFISPSNFLRERYIRWGIAENRIHVIENIQEHQKSIEPRKLKYKETRNRFAFFGQINKYKGVLEILKSLEYISTNYKTNLIFEIHGINRIDENNHDFKKEYQILLSSLIKKGIVILKGPYEKEDLKNRMSNIDWVVVPSIWWENSPMVIQEAFSFKRPIICSDIGGMKEKVKHNVDGIHVAVGNIEVWATTLVDCSQDNKLWDRLYKNIKAPLTQKKIIDQHFKLIKN